MKPLITLLAICSISTPAYGNNLPESNEALYEEIQSMDNQLFTVAFNQCNLEVWKKIMSKDLEFYDDRTGLNTSYEKEVRAFNDRCSKPFAVTRQLVSTEIHLLREYGAVQTGIHNFYVDDNLVEKSQFIIIWQRTDNGWMVKRVVSYDHQLVESEST
ncbi:nuclear transport factor 2 family protein [Kangiella sp.]|uniref:nuclear transport factor 2 family protein n=1 Tax=Kangiella sp. TaxID=1920245 RepID=UPI003A8F27CB